MAIFRKRYLARLLLLTALATARQPVLSQLTQEGEPYRRVVGDVVVRYLGEAPTSDDYITTRISARKGRYISQAELSHDQRALLDTGLIADVRILLESMGEEVRVIYEVRHRLRFHEPAAVVGNQRFSKAKVRDMLKLAGGDYIDEALLAARCDAIRSEYRKRHYPEPEVKATLMPRADGFAEVRVEINEGERSKITGFLFSGNQAIDGATLRAALGKPSPLNPVPFFYVQWRERAASREIVQDTLLQLYHNRGYLDAQVVVDTNARLERGRRWVGVEIDEGPRYLVDSVTISGVTKFPLAELDKAVATAIRRDDVAGRGTIEQATRALRDYYGERGYVDTRIRVETPIVPAAASAEPRIALRFDIQEGLLAHVRNIVIRGNTRTQDRVIRREIVLAPGEILNEVRAEQSRIILENLGYFERVRLDEIPDRENPAQRDVVYEVTEKNTGQLMIGAGFSSVDKIIGFAEVSQANFDLFNWPYFHGGGQKLRLSMEAGSETRNIDLSLVEPWFLQRRLSLVGELYWRELRYNEYDVRRVGAGAGITLPLKYGRLNLHYNLEQVKLSDVMEGEFFYVEEPERSFRFTDEEDSYRSTPLRLTWLYDTRNRAFVPTKGTRGSLFAEVNGTITGGDQDIWRLGGDFRHWLPLWAGHVLSLRARAESVDTYGSQSQVPISERLFLGGGRTVRGYRYRDIGTKVIPDAEDGGRHRPVGGLSMIMASAEYTIPLAKVLRLAAFYDIGGVWNESFDADFSRLASSVGFGIRFDIPGFPIRIDYAKPLKRDDDYTRSERFNLWIGFE